MTEPIQAIQKNKRKSYIKKKKVPVVVWTPNLTDQPINVNVNVNHRRVKYILNSSSVIDQI